MIILCEIIIYNRRLKFDLRVGRTRVWNGGGGEGRKEGVHVFGTVCDPALRSRKPLPIIYKFIICIKHTRNSCSVRFFMLRDSRSRFWEYGTRTFGFSYMFPLVWMLYDGCGIFNGGDNLVVEL